ncbi:hypothetical protein Dimus_011492 [Dionaea muscipula]
MRKVLLLARSLLVLVRWNGASNSMISLLFSIQYSHAIVLVLAIGQINRLSKQQLEEKMKLMEIMDQEEKIKQVVKLEREKAEAASKAANQALASARREAYQRRDAERKSIREAKQTEKLRTSTVYMGSIQQYQHFTREEILSATSSFSPSLMIGKGSNGTVYKCELRHRQAPPCMYT